MMEQDEPDGRLMPYEAVSSLIESIMGALSFESNEILFQARVHGHEQTEAIKMTVATLESFRLMAGCYLFVCAKDSSGGRDSSFYQL